jgi:hypothetical protein
MNDQDGSNNPFTKIDFTGWFNVSKEQKEEYNETFARVYSNQKSFDSPFIRLLRDMKSSKPRSR